MPATTTKTLEATLAPPTAHKERKLRDLLTTYRDGLHEVFEAGCETMNAVSDIVTPYDLPYQAKAALCNYVPDLLDADTYDESLGDQGDPRYLITRQEHFLHYPR